ncbi:MAG: response regulator, partial [Planctomycetota bacterium]
MSKRILIVDDDEAHAEVCAEALAGKVDKISMATSGEEGMRQLREGPEFAVVLTDLVMRDADGFKVLESARRRNPSTKVLMLTGHGSREVAVKAMQEGALYYLEKPVDLE